MNGSTLEYHLPKNDKEIRGIKLILGYFGIFLIFIGIVVLLPLVLLIFYPEESNMFPAFLIPGTISMAVGAALFGLIFKRPKGKLTAMEDIILVVGVWLLIVFISAIPFLFYGYNFTQSFFESTSGYTDAGLSALNWSEGVMYKTLEDGTTDVTCHMLVFHRAMTQLVGGTGLVLIVSGAVNEKSSVNIYLLEGHNDKLLPNLTKSARLIFGLYLGIIIVGTCLYIAVGVTPFDAVCHSMAAVATGGFSTKTGSIHQLVREVSMRGEWRGIMVELITELLMILGGTNFVIHYSFLRRKFGVLRHYEYEVFIGTLILFYPFMVIGFSHYYQNVGAGFRFAFFDLISAVSTTGYTAIDNYQGHMLNGTFIPFPSYLYALIGLLMCSGMQNGSTSAGIKQSRLSLMFKDIWWRIKDSSDKPENYHVHTVWKFGHKTRVEQSEITEAETYIGMYMILLMLGSALISVIASNMGLKTTLADGSTHYYNFQDAFFEFSSSLGGIGLSSGLTSYTTPSVILWIELIGMLFGRLEIFVYFTAIAKGLHSFRRRKFIYNPKKMEKQMELNAANISDAEEDSLLDKPTVEKLQTEPIVEEKTEAEENNPVSEPISEPIEEKEKPTKKSTKTIKSEPQNKTKKKPAVSSNTKAKSKKTKNGGSHVQ